jgi:hypothetical protein
MPTRQDKGDNSLSKQEVIVFAIILLAAFIISFYLLFPIIDSPKTPDLLLGPIGLLLIIGFDIAWVLIMKLLLKSHPKTKMFLMLLGITLSTSFLVWWIIEKTSLFDHMFG